MRPKVFATSGPLEGKLITALDESRLLILGAQVLFGFQFEAVFQELFENIRADSQAVHCAGLAALLITIGCLIAPSMFHQIVYRGESRQGALKTAPALAGASLLPLTLGLGSSAFVIFDRMFGRNTGILANRIKQVLRELARFTFCEGLILAFPAAALAAIESKTPAEFPRQGSARWMTNGEH